MHHTRMGCSAQQRPKHTRTHTHLRQVSPPRRVMNGRHGSPLAPPKRIDKHVHTAKRPASSNNPRRMAPFDCVITVRRPDGLCEGVKGVVSAHVGAVLHTCVNNCKLMSHNKPELPPPFRTCSLARPLPHSHLVRRIAGASSAPQRPSIHIRTRKAPYDTLYNATRPQSHDGERKESPLALKIAMATRTPMHESCKPRHGLERASSAGLGAMGLPRVSILPPAVVNLAGNGSGGNTSSEHYGLPWRLIW